MVHPKKVLYLLILGIFFNTACAKENVVQVKEGNLALPSSQQAAPLFAFGQTTTDQGDVLAFVYYDQTKGNNLDYKEIVPSLLLGVTDKLTFFVTSAIFLYHKLDNGNHSLGIQNISPQLEYSFYSNDQPAYSDRATIVANVTLPLTTSPIAPLSTKQPNFRLGSPRNPTTNAGTPTFFLGATISRTHVDWFPWASAGVVLTVKEADETKFGNQYFFQWGVGRNIPSSKKWILMAQLEFNTIVAEQNKIIGKTDLHSGGTIIFVGPSFWASNKLIIFQAGISFPLYQHLPGGQNKNYYFAATNLGVKF